MTGSESEEVPEESKVYDAEEYVDPGMELGLPDAESSEGGAASGPEGEASQADGGKTPAETEAESSAEDSTRAETGGEGT